MNFMKFLLSQHFFDILFLNIWWTVAQNPTKHTIFWRSMMRPFRWISMNCFNRFRFLAEVSTNLHKMHYFVQFKLCLIFIFVFEKCQNSFSWGPPFVPFWSAKYLNFGAESCEIKILSNLIQEISTLRKIKNQVLLFQSGWEPNLSDLMVY